MHVYILIGMVTGDVELVPVDTADDADDAERPVSTQQLELQTTEVPADIADDAERPVSTQQLELQTTEYLVDISEQKLMVSPTTSSSCGQTVGDSDMAVVISPVHVPITAISPIPQKPNAEQGRRGRATGQTVVLTSSPYRKMLEMKKNSAQKRGQSTKKLENKCDEVQVEAKNNKRGKRGRERAENTQSAGIEFHEVVTVTAKGNKRRKAGTGTKTLTKTDISVKEPKRGRKQTATIAADKDAKKKKQKSQHCLSDTAVDCDDNVPCLYCGEKFCNSLPERWVQCTACKNWAREACSGIDDNEHYICEICV